MFQGFFKLEVASAERDFIDLLSYQSTPKYSVEEGFKFLQRFVFCFLVFFPLLSIT